MQQREQKKLRLCYGAFLGAFTVAVGILYIVAAADIYYSGAGGEEIYSREIVGKKLFSLLVPSVLWVVAVVAGYVLSVLFPLLPAKGKGRTSALRKLRARVPAGESEAFLSERKALKREDLIRLCVWSVCAAVWLVSAVVCLVYLCGTAHFKGENINTEVLAMLKNVFPWFGASLLLSCGAAVFEIFYERRALPHVKKLIVLGKGSPAARPSLPVRVKSAAYGVLSAENTVVGLRLALLVLGVTFVVLGLFNGGMRDVLGKAIMICTECIGLG